MSKNTLSTLADRASHTQCDELGGFRSIKKDSYVYYMGLGTREIYSITLQVCKLSFIFFTFYCSTMLFIGTGGGV